MGKIILITGASRGIGREAARLLAARGATVILASRDKERAARAATETGSAASVALDVNNDPSIQAAAAEIGARFGRIDVLINNAAILLDHYGNLVTLAPETLLETLETNTIGPLRVSLAMLPLLQKSDDPRIINVSSGAGQLHGDPQNWAPAYSISKTALNMLTQQFTAAFPDIAVNSMCPGWCRTEMGGEEAPLTAEEGADTMVWLALDATSSLRGSFIKERQTIPW